MLFPMATVSTTSNLARHISTARAQVGGTTVREVLAAYFDHYPQLRAYVLDDQGAVRKHVVVFINSELLRDRKGLSDAVQGSDEIYIAQALSGG